MITIKNTLIRVLYAILTLSTTTVFLKTVSATEVLDSEEKEEVKEVICYKTEDDILNEFSTVSKITSEEKEEIWNGSKYAPIDVEYIQIINYKKMKEEAEKLASMFDETPYVFDIDKYIETQDFDASLTYDIKKLPKLFKDNLGTFIEIIKELKEEAEYLIKDKEMEEFAEELINRMNEE